MCHEAVKIDLDGHKTTGTYESATRPLGRTSVGSKWVFTYTTGKGNLIVKTKAKLVAKGFNHVQDVDYLYTRTKSVVSSS